MRNKSPPSPKYRAVNLPNYQLTAPGGAEMVPPHHVDAAQKAALSR
jgi:hypothetical protein